MSQVLYVLACGAPPARDVEVLTGLAQDRGWDVCVITSPMGSRFVDAARLEKMTGHPVRSDYKAADDPDVLPPPDALAVAPATTNTINKWAAGISDNLALGLMNEAIGLGIPVVAAPYVNAPLARHPAISASIATLRGAGVTIVDLPTDLDPDGFPWTRVLDALPAPG